MKKTFLSLVQPKEEKDINVFTGEPDEDMDIVSTDGETVVSAQLQDNYKLSFQQLLKFQITRGQYDKHASLLDPVHRLKEDYSIQQIHRSLSTLYGNDRFLLSSHMHKLAKSYSSEVFRLQSRLQDIQKPVPTQKNILVIPKAMFVDTLNSIGLLFDVASKKKTHHTLCETFETSPHMSYESLSDSLKRHCSLSTGDKYGYTYDFVQQAKNAFYSLVSRMEEAREQQVPEEEAFIVPEENKTPDTEEINEELREELDETLRLHAYMHGAALLKRISILLYHLAATVTPNK